MLIFGGVSTEFLQKPGFVQGFSSSLGCLVPPCRTREAQIYSKNPKVKCVNFRGNVQTRSFFFVSFFLGGKIWYLEVQDA